MYLIFWRQIWIRLFSIILIVAYSVKVIYFVLLTSGKFIVESLLSLSSKMNQSASLIFVCGMCLSKNKKHSPRMTETRLHHLDVIIYRISGHKIETKTNSRKKSPV